MSQPISCLLVDNDEDDQELFCMALQEIDPTISCAIANNGVEALKALKESSAFPSIIFVDLNMPLMNGKQCLQEIRHMEHLVHVPVYLYSTSADPRTVEEIMGLGAKDFLMKPSSFSSLVSMLSPILKPQNSLS